MIILPFPPTTNSLTGIFNGRKIKTRRYREWEKAASWDLKRCTKFMGKPKPDDPSVIGAYHLEITLVRPDKRPRDCNNYDKAISDLLVTHGITPDDHLMQSLTVRWSDAVEGPTVKVRAG